MLPRYQVFLANSGDMSRITELTKDARNKQLVLALNKAGTFTFNLPISTEWFDYLNPTKQCIIIQKNKKVVWSGPIWTKSEDFTSGKIDLSAAGWFQLLHKRYYTDGELTFTSTNDGVIAFDFLAYANGQTIDGVARTTWITQGINTSVATRTITYNQWQNIGEIIENLTAIENGMDFIIDPVTRKMDIRAWSDFDQPNVVLAQNWGPNNATGTVRQSNADDQANQYYVVGETNAAEAHDTASVSEYNLHQNVINLSETDEPSLLGAVANAELAINKNPRVVINFAPKPLTDKTENIPSFFEDYKIRDMIHLTAIRESAKIKNLAVRVFGITIDIDEQGDEKISNLQTTYQTS